MGLISREVKGPVIKYGKSGRGGGGGYNTLFGVR